MDWVLGAMGLGAARLGLGADATLALLAMVLLASLGALDEKFTGRCVASCTRGACLGVSCALSLNTETD